MIRPALIERAHAVADGFAKSHGIAADWLTGPAGGLALTLADFARLEALAELEEVRQRMTYDADERQVHARIAAIHAESEVRP